MGRQYGSSLNISWKDRTDLGGVRDTIKEKHMRNTDATPNNEKISKDITKEKLQEAINSGEKKQLDMTK